MAIFISFAGLTLVLGAISESAKLHCREQILQIAGLCIIGVCAVFSNAFQNVERRYCDRIVFLLFVAIVLLMAIRPDLFQPTTLSHPDYRGTIRWTGWTLDPNNSGLVLSLGAVASIRLAHEFPLSLSRTLWLVAGLCTLQLARTFSRIGMLAAALALFVWLYPRWQLADRRFKLCTSIAALVALLVLPTSVSVFRSSDVLLARRAASITNVMDLSWANRLYVLPGTIQAMLDRPWRGWGWDNVLPVVQQVYSPTFLPDNTALLLNDYAHLGASYGIPLLVLVVFIIGWCLVYGRSPYAKMTLIVFSVAMFFQGVVRIPITFIPLCISVGVLLGEHPPWKKANWHPVSLPVLPTLCVLGFLGTWCVAPFLMTNKTVRVTDRAISISPKTAAAMTLAFVVTSNLTAHAQQARAAASQGVNAAVIRPEAIPDFERLHGTNVWFVTGGAGQRTISPDELNRLVPMLRGVHAVRRMFDAANIVSPPTPAPDRPFPIRSVISTLFVCVLVFVIRECAVNSRHRVSVGLVAATLIAIGLATPRPKRDWAKENSETANWARQMYRTAAPDAIYEEFVLNPEVTPAFSIRNRRELWHTFYQTSRAERPAEMLARIQASIECQVVVIPDKSEELRSFDVVWRSRVCNFTERQHLLAAVLRTLNLPARVAGGRVEMWGEGSWLPASR